jgi:hypothetical protein
MSGHLRAPLAVEILHRKLSRNLHIFLKLVVQIIFLKLVVQIIFLKLVCQIIFQTKTPNNLSDHVQGSLAGPISLYMEQTGNRADVMCAFE